MIVSVEALGLEEDLSRVEASVADLITAKEAGDMAGTSKMWDFRPSLMTKDMIEELGQLGCFGDAKVNPLEGRQFLSRRPLMLWFLRISFSTAFASRWHASFARCWRRLRYNFTI